MDLVEPYCRSDHRSVLRVVHLEEDRYLQRCKCLVLVMACDHVLSKKEIILLMYKKIRHIIIEKEGGKIMKKKLLQYHEKIDMVSATILLYCLLVLVLIPIFDFISNEWLYASIILTIPCIVVSRRKNRIRFDKLLHYIFGFRR
nr:MAG TPA_asm: hypothetical protein [Caudoviricetes sp.]